MGATKRAAALILSVAAVLSGCERWGSSSAPIPLTVAPGLSIPDVDQLAKKLEAGPGAKAYTREKGKWAEIKPAPLGKPLSADVRSFDAKQNMAYVELTYRGSNIPVIQIWRFDGKTWSDSVDAGILVR